MFGEPILLPRRTEARQVQLRTASCNRADDCRRLILRKITVACPRNAQLRKACLQACGRGGRNALLAAKKIDSEISRGGAGTKPLDQFDAGDALAQRRSTAARD